MGKILLILTLVFFMEEMTKAQWGEQTSGQTSVFYSVSAVDDNNAWICGASGKVLRTTDGGTTWTSVINPTGSALYNIFAIDANTALTTSSPNATFVYRTSNAGVNWSQVFTQTGGFIDAIWMTTPLTGLMYGDPVGGRWSLWKTTNGGVNWDSTGLYVAQVGADAGWNNALFNLGTTFWFGTNSTRIYNSIDNGTTWTTQTTPAANQYAIWFNSPLTGMAGDDAAMFTTVNGGTTWNTASPPGTANISGITGVGIIWWFTRQAGIIYRSNDNGATWSTEYTAPAGVFFHITKARTGNRLWAVRNNGGISKSEGVIGITPISGEIPKSYSLSQNYPNPFNPSTKINFAIPKSSNVVLKVYNMLGEEAAVIYSGYLAAGKYSADFNAANLASGIYFYSLRAEGFTETKKMSLIK